MGGFLSEFIVKISFSANSMLLAIIIILLAKVFVFFVVWNFDFRVFGGGNDADYYDAYALGHMSVAVNIWPIILKWLADIDIYSRSGIVYLYMFISLLIIPLMVSRLALVSRSPARNKVFLILFIITSVYPSLFYLAMDVYRDIAMIFIFVIGLFIYKGLSTSASPYERLIQIVAALLVSFILYKFRAYLGFAYFVTIVTAWAYRFSKYRISYSVGVFLLFLNMLFVFGLLEPILQYRDIFQDGMSGGSNIGILFDSKLTFTYDFIRSFITQMLGLYFPNVSSILAFFGESVPFFIALIYVVKNREFRNKFIDYIVVFFVAYSLVWVIGNDNLGTASRLRVFNYISIYVAALVVYQNKLIHYNKIYNA